jgi:hypothetical protein
MRAMADDWRLTVDFDDEEKGTQLVEWLSALEFASEERHRLGKRVVVSREGAHVFLYADTETLAHEVEAVVHDGLADQKRQAHVRLERWHPVAEEWKDPSVPLPTSEDELEAERDERLEREAEDSAETGHAEWEVRVELRSHRDTVQLARRLEADGIPLVRRFRYLLAGAVNEEQARELAERLKREAPADATVHAQPSGEMVWEVTPGNPFVGIGGGLGG